MTEEKKYRLTDEMQKIRDYTLFRIEALRDFADVKKGDLGGFIEKERNLAHEGNCWIYDNACAYDRAEVIDDAQLRDHVTASGRSRISASAIATEFVTIYGNTRIRGNSFLAGESIVHNHAIVDQNAMIYGKAMLLDHSEAKGHCRIYGYGKLADRTRAEGSSHVAGDAHLSGYTHVSTQKYFGGPAEDPCICIGPFSDKSGVQIWVTLEKQSGQLNSAYFKGNLDEFEVYACEKLNIDVFAVSSFLKSFMKWK